ncbi:MAG TPA: hypothetical protein PKC18_02710 [Lacipirellulaceae bacterium]|nr:hypothetical protein [Lacipirellulaceae bacterium]
MDRVGISFQAPLSSDQVRLQFVTPLRTALESARAGIYSNYLRQQDDDDGPTEHLLVFQVREFEEGLRLLRVELEKIGVPGTANFHNLNPSQPMY